MKYYDLKIGEEYNLKKRNIKARLKSISKRIFQPVLYEFETPAGNIHVFSGTTPETDDIELLETNVENSNTDD